MILRGAVVGVGYLGHFHAQKFKALCEGPFRDKIEFIGVCDVNSEQASKVASSLGVKAFSKASDLIGKVDFVTIATMTSTHYELAKFFLEHGVHVNVEKPMTETVKQAQELNSLAEKKSLVLCVGHSERFNPAVRHLTTLLKRPNLMELNRHAPYKSRGADVSVIHDLMIHDIDLALFLSQEKQPQVKVTQALGARVISPTLDWAVATLQFSSGLCARISVSRLATAMTRTLRVLEGKTMFEVNLQTSDCAQISYKDVQTPAETTSTNLGKGDNLLLENEAFFYSVLAEKSPFISGRQGQIALEVVEEVHRQIELNHG